MEIPKIIHYCWFGGNPLPVNAQKCIASWRKFMPDYKIKEWNENNFDVNIIPYTAEAYKARKYAFVSDYARFWVLYNYGGLYFDTDVEVIKDMNDIVARGPFMGCENEAKSGATPAELGVAPGLGLYKDVLEVYRDKHCFLPNGTISNETVVTIVTRLLCERGLKNINEIQNVSGVWIYPKKYFCPKDYTTGRVSMTPYTYSIHHYDASWLPWYVLLEHKICYKMHIRCFDVLNKVFYTKTFVKDFINLISQKK